MDKAEIDEAGRGRQFYGKGIVHQCSQVESQDDVFLLESTIILNSASQLGPKPGQFYLLRSAKSRVEYGRPISVYMSREQNDAKTGLTEVRLQFLILKKGTGTEELSSLLPGDEITVIGPLGNTFDIAEGISVATSDHPEICIVGGGIGVAPVAYFASSLAPKSYDFFASFKSGSYGLEHVKAAHLTITTDDGSVGVHGMLPAAFTAETVKQAGYKVIYACGPLPMLAYIQKIARECGIQCYLSMENRMLCGVGACLGCTIPTTDGNRRVCTDGPVFDSRILLFSRPQPKRTPLNVDDLPNLAVDIAGVHFANPVIAASGTYGFGQNYRGLSDVNVLGGIVAKGCTLEPRLGNTGVRVIEVASGNINSIGLQNPGIQHFIDKELPEMLKLKPVAIANLAGSDLESYVEGAKLLDKTDIKMIELNISCPNVKAGGMAWGTNPELAKECVQAVKKATRKPLMVKLTPNAPSIVDVAVACAEAGADALSLINSIQAVAINVDTAKPFFNNIRAGLSGPAVKPIALRMVYDVVEALDKLPAEKRIPVVGMGGIASWRDAVEFIMAGASAIQVGSAKFSNPRVMEEIIMGLKIFMRTHGYRTINEMKGAAQQNGTL